jgi:proton glutamate symport protein
MIALIRRLSLSQWILVAMVVGILFGCLISSGNLSPAATENCRQACKLGASAFLHLVKCIIVPLIFSTLVVGIAGHTDDMKAVGRLAFKSILYFEIVTTVALLVWLGGVYVIGPGAGLVV